MVRNVRWWFDDEFANVFMTDYTSYLVIYKCVQQWFDLYTNEYVEVYSRSTSLTTAETDTIKNQLSSSLGSNFSKTDLKDVKVNPNDCKEQDVWGIF